MPGTTPPDDAAALSAGVAFDASGEDEHATIASPRNVANADRAGERNPAELCVRMRRKIARSELSGFGVPVLEFPPISGVAIALGRQRSCIWRKRPASDVRREQLTRSV